MRRGFSFTEILFAVMILGIGFIMVAAMFPVAIQQTQATAEETMAASVAKAGVDYMRQVSLVRCTLPLNSTLVTSGVMPANTPTSILLPTFPDPRFVSFLASTTSFAPGTVFPLRIPGQVWSLHESAAKDLFLVFINGSAQVPHRDALWQAAARDCIWSSDPSYAWVGMYKRDLIAQIDPSNPSRVIFTPAPDAQIIIAAVRARNRQVYDPDVDLAHRNPSLPATLEPQLTNLGAASLTRNGINSILNITDPASGRIAEGTYLVLAWDGQPGPWGAANPNGSGGLFAGHVYRVGTGSNTQWQLAPGNDLTVNDPAGGFPRAQFLLIGRGLANPLQPVQGPAGFIGPTQDIAVYTGFIPIN